MFAIVITLQAYSQEKTATMLFGDVQTIGTKKPIPYATVSIKGTNIGTTADKTGHFKLSSLPVGKVVIIAQALGYKSQEKQLQLAKGKALNVIFSLKEDAINISEVTVFGKASVLYTKEIDGKYLEQVQALDIKDVFADIPSVTIGGGGANAQRLYLRGIEGSNLNIIIDGAKQGRSLFQHRGNAGSIDPGLLKKVNVATGADASQSSGALGGSISFETIDAQDLSYEFGKVGGKVSVGTYGAANSYVTRAIVGTKLTPSVGILAAVSYNDENDYRAADYGIIPYTGRKATNLFAKLSLLDMNSHNLRVSATYNINKGDYITGGPGSDMGIPSASQKSVFQEMSRGTYAADYSYNQSSPLLNIKANTYYNNRHLKNESYGLDVNSNNIGASLKNYMNVDIKGLKNKFTIGADFDSEDGICAPGKKNAQTLGTEEINNVSKVFGAFAQGVSKISIFSLTYGIRFDAFNSNFGPENELEGNRLSPNAGIAISPVKGLHIYGNYKEAIRATGIIPIGWMANIVEGANINNGKPFDPETSVMFDGGIRYTKTGLFTENDNFTASGKYFHSTIDNLIEVLSGGRKGAPVTGIMNDSLGVVSDGYEFALEWKYKTLKTQIDYIHVDIKDKDGNYIEVTRRKAASAGDRINWRTTFQATPEILIGYSLNAVAELKDVYDTPRPGYTLHNIHMSWSPKAVKGLRASIAVNNLSNKEYSEHTSIEKGEAIVPEAGRDIRVTLSYSF